MQNSAFSPEQYVDAASLNAFSSAVSGNTALGQSSLALPGLISPTAITNTVTGLVVASTLAKPFGVLFGNGVLAQAHGILTNADTQSYSTDFTASVPVSGAAVTAYLLASYAQIQQAPFQIIGPPPGHPDYNPDFVPATAYALNVDSLALAASLTPADNQTTFELARTTLVSGASTLVLDTTAQVCASALNTLPVLQVSGSPALTAANAGQLLTALGAYTPTLPAVSGSIGLVFSFAAAAPSGSVVATVLGSDRIYGTAAAVGSGSTTLTLSNGQQNSIIGTAYGWQVLANSLSASYIQQQPGNYAVDAGSTNAVSATFSPPVSGHIAGALFKVLAQHANTGAATFDAGGGASALTDTQGHALAYGALLPGMAALIQDTGSSYQLLNPAFISSIAANGSLAIGGLWIQWGTVSFTPSGGATFINVSITFPSLFPTQCFGGVATGQGKFDGSSPTTAGSQDTVILEAGSFSTSGCTARVDTNVSNTLSGTHSLFYIVLGK